MWKPQQKNSGMVIELNLSFGLRCGVNVQLLWLLNTFISPKNVVFLWQIQWNCFSRYVLTQSWSSHVVTSVTKYQADNRLTLICVSQYFFSGYLPSYHNPTFVCSSFNPADFITSLCRFCKHGHNHKNSLNRCIGTLLHWTLWRRGWNRQHLWYLSLFFFLATIPIETESPKDFQAFLVHLMSVAERTN